MTRSNEPEQQHLDSFEKLVAIAAQRRALATDNLTSTSVQELETHGVIITEIGDNPKTARCAPKAPVTSAKQATLSEHSLTDLLTSSSTARAVTTSRFPKSFFNSPRSMSSMASDTLSSSPKGTSSTAHNAVSLPPLIRLLRLQRTRRFLRWILFLVLGARRSRQSRSNGQNAYDPVFFVPVTHGCSSRTQKVCLLLVACGNPRRISNFFVTWCVVGVNRHGMIPRNASNAPDRVQISLALAAKKLRQRCVRITREKAE